MLLRKTWHKNIDWPKELDKLRIENKTVNGVSSFDCPKCGDTGNGKGYIKWSSGRFYCFRDDNHGDLGISVLVLLGANEQEVERDYKDPRQDLIVEQEVIEKTKKLWNDCQDRDWALPLIKALKARGITKEIVEKYEIGFQLPYHRSKPYRLSIPIKDAEGRYILQRLYLPSECIPLEGKHPKFVNSPKGNKAALFPIEQLKYDKILICGGELKAILAAEQLNQHGIGAITTTGGEGKNYDTFREFFRDKEVYVCMDVDDKGQQSEMLVATCLFSTAKQVSRASLPDELKDEFPKGDVNDFIVSGGNLLDLITNAEEFVPPSLDLNRPFLKELNEGSFIKLSEVVDNSLTGRLHTEGVLTSIDKKHYTIPQRITPTCPRNQDTLCTLCPISQKKQGESYGISSDRPELFEQIGEPTNKRDKLFKQMFGVPGKCPVFSYEVNERTSACVGRLKLLDPESKEEVDTLVFNNIEADNMANPIEFKGFAVSSPKDTVFTVIITEEIPSPRSLKYFELDDDEEEKLRQVLQPKEWTKESIWDKLNERYNDLSHNVTRIYDSRGMHLAIDLVFHSFRYFSFCGDSISGMLDVCILGDTGQGKTKVAKSLKDHYGNLAAWVDSSHTSVPGLVLGGDKKAGGGFLLKYGTLPRMNNRMAIFEELDTLPPEVFDKLKVIRSEKIARVDKIFNAEAPANVRMLYLCNPKDGGKIVPDSSSQMITLEHLFDGASNVRRMDFAYVIWNDPDRDRYPNNTYEHTLTKELCTSHLMWAWSQNERTIKFDDAAIAAILKLEKSMAAKYSSEIPLVLNGDQKNKLARLSGACAAITFSTRVRECHVEVANEFIQKHYDSPELNYKGYSDQQKERIEIINEEMLLDKIKTRPLLINNVIDSWGFTARNFDSWAEDSTVAKSILLQLRASYVIYVVKGNKTNEERYRATPNGIKFLQKVLKDVKK